MILRRLRARNLGAFLNLDTPEFGPAGNVLVGPNGAGKSTFRRALSLGLTGTCDGYETGQGLAELRSTHGDLAKKWGIQIEIVDEKGEVHTFQRRDDEGPRSQAQQLIESLVECPGPKARACLHTSEFLRLDAKARQRLVLDLAPRQAIEIPAEIRAAIKAAIAEDHASADVATLDRLHKAVYGERESVGREVKAHAEGTAPSPPEDFADLADRSVADLDAEASAMRADVDALVKERDAALVKATPKRVDTTVLEARVTELDRKLASTLKEIEGIPTPEKVRARAKELAAKLIEAGKENEALDAKRRELSAKHGELKGTAAAAKRALDVFKGSGGGSECPVCATKLKAAERRTVEDALDKKWKGAENEAQRIKVELDAIPDPLKTTDIQAEADGLDAKAKRRQDLEAEADRLEQELGKARERLEAAKADAGTPGDPEASAQAVEFAERIAKGNALIEALREYAGARRRHEQSVAAKAAAEARYQELTRLLDALGPNGIRKAIGGGDGLFRLHEDLNATLEPLGFSVDLRPVVDLYGDPLVTFEGGRTVAASSLSRSEGIRFGAAFAIAVAKATGLGIVVVDDFDALDPDASEAVFAMLDASGCQWFALAVQTSEDYPATAAALNAEGGTRYLHVLAGEISLPANAQAGEAA